MDYTISDLVNSGLIPELRLLTGAREFDRIPIRYSSVQELSALDGFIRRDELILTTAEGCLDNEERFLMLLQTISRAQAAALLIAVRDPEYVVLPNVVAYADSVGLPVFRIPWEQRFADIQNAVASGIREKRALGYQELQSRLSNAFFESRTLPEAAELIYQFLQTPLAIVDANGKTLAESGVAEAPDSELERCTEIAIDAGDMPYGALCLYMNGCADGVEQELAAAEELIHRYVCFPLSLWFIRKSMEEMAALRVRSDFVWDLANGNYRSIVEMTKQGARLQFDLNRPYACALMRAIPKNDAGSAYSDAVSTISARMEELLLQEGASGGWDVMVSGRVFDFILYIGIPQKDPTPVVLGWVDRTQNRLRAAFPAYAFRWGISEIGHRPPDFAQLYRNASVALQWCMDTNRPQYYLTYKDTKEAQIVSVLSGSEKIRQMAQEIIAPLRDYDAKSRIDLTGTLIAFIRCGGNTSLTARTLHIHRQSLLYRLAKIEELTELSLDNHQDWFLLEAATRILAHVRE